MLLAAAPAAAQTPAEIDFRYERPVQTGGAGPRRLPIDVTLLTGSDPFRVVRLPPRAHRPSPLRPGRTRSAVPAGLESARAADLAGPRRRCRLPPVETPTQKTSGFEVDLGQAIAIDRFRIDGISPPFLKRVRLEGSGDRDQVDAARRGRHGLQSAGRAPASRPSWRSRPDRIATFA